MQNESKSFGIIGLGRFGAALAIKLSQLGAEVLVVDEDDAKVRAVRAYTDNAFVVSDLSLETLRETGIQNCDTVIIGIGSQIDASILTTLHIKQLGVTEIIAKATTEDQGTILTSLGAKIVFPERDMAERLAAKLSDNNVLERISLSNEVDITELKLSKRMNGKTIRNFDFRTNYGLNVIAIVRQNQTIIELNPDEPLHEDDVIAVLGTKENIARFENFLLK
ncbi:MAG: TrkA family potassium uptake protein [Clostridiales bacterium]|nr:TrkA family potassium uptake protein [Clostridiales bacterium]